MQTRQIQIVDRFPANASLFSEDPQSELTCNVSGCRKRSRDEQLSLPPVLRVSGSSLVAASFGLKNGLGFDDSGAVSTSGRMSIDSPAALSFGQEIVTHICRHNLEMEALVRFQNERIRLGVEETRKRHCRSLISIIDQLVVKRLREKENELEDANRKNAELQDKIQQMSAESELWFNVAKNNEVLVSNLRTNLEQVLLQNSAVPPVREGYGDSVETPLPADDAQSFCFEDDVRLNEVIQQQLNCKVCGVDKVCVLVLPCRHLCVCQNCESGIASCPICNCPKSASFQVFI